MNLREITGPIGPQLLCRQYSASSAPSGVYIHSAARLLVPAFPFFSVQRPFIASWPAWYSHSEANPRTSLVSGPTRRYSIHLPDDLFRDYTLTNGMDSYTLVEFHNTGVMLKSQFERLGRIEDLDEAIRLGRLVERYARPDHPHYADFLSNLANRLQRRYEYLSIEVDLQDAIGLSRRAVEATADTNPRKKRFLMDLAVKLARRHGGYQCAASLNEAIALAEQALAATSEDRIEKAEFHHNISNMYESRYAAQRSESDLGKAIEHATRGVETTPSTHPNYGDLLNGYSSLLFQRFMLRSVLEDLDEAVIQSRNAIRSTPDEHPYMAGCLITLSHNLWKRFEQTGRMEDLSEARLRANHAVKTTLKTAIDYPSRLNTLGAILQTCYERSGDIADLDAAITATKDGAERARGRNREPMYLSNLSALFIMRFDVKHDESDLTKGIEHAQGAVDLAQEGHAGRASYLNNLGIALERGFREKGNLEDLQRAVKAGDDALQVTNQRSGQEDVDLPGRLNNLAHRLCLSGAAEDEERALKYFERSWNCRGGVPFHRLDAARQTVKLLTRRRRWSEAKDIACQAVDLLPIMINRSLTRQDQQHVASRFSGLVSDACALLLEHDGSAEEALMLLERGRGSITSLLIDDRSDMSELWSSHPEEAEIFERIRVAINAGNSAKTEQSRAGQVESRDRLDLSRELDASISKIRKLPGHDRFLMGPSLSELKSCALEGPVVFVNVAKLRSDAIIVSFDVIHHLHLPGLSYSDSLAFLKSGSTNHGALSQDLDRSRDIIRDIASESEREDNLNLLSWLWWSCVKPILEHLKSSSMAANVDIPRVWWVGTGAASSFPFHAAGDMSAGSSESTLDQVIPSYTPTLKALAHSRRQALTRTHGRQRDEKASTLIVCMPTTPQQRSLPGVSREKIVVERACDGIALSQTLEYPTAGELLEKLRTADMIHFACHASSDPVNPSASHLMLQKITAAGLVVDRLTVSDISGVGTLEKPWLAYLSACATAEVRARVLADEGLHISSAFLVIGIPHVIGSLWAVDDSLCVTVAEYFYEDLICNGRFDYSNQAPAAALRKAILRARKICNEPSRWGAFIHSGA